MFPWAEGDSLRDHWNRTPTKGPSHGLISQTITQLLGIADALTKLHNYRAGRRRTLSSHSVALAVPVNNDAQSDEPMPLQSDPQFDLDYSDDDDVHVQNRDSIRHGDLKPENILRFTDSDHELGTLKIADMGLAKQHVLATSDRCDKRQITSTRYGTQPYEAPETITESARSRLYDVWSMGCITLEFIIWILYGNEPLTSFYDQIAGGPKLPYQYYEITDPNEPNRAEVHRVVLKWIKHIESNDPECSQNSAIRDLLTIVREKLLVVRLPPSRVSSQSGGRPLAPPALGGALQFRATAEEFRDALLNILEKAKEQAYLFTGKDRGNARPPASMLSPEAATRVGGPEAGRLGSPQLPLVSGVLGRPIRADYSLPPLKDWQFHIDHTFANALAARIGTAAFLPQSERVPNLCDRCSRLEFWTGGFSLDDNVPDLLVSAQTCDLCKLLRDARRDDDTPAIDRVRFERKESNLLLAGGSFPVLSFLCVPNARTARHFQIGFPELPEPGTDAFFGILGMWLEDCDTTHKDPKNQDRNCAGIPKQRLPTRLIDVGNLERPVLRLVETQVENLKLEEEYIALSHPWGDTSKYSSFSTLRKDSGEGARHEIDTFKKAIPYERLPATFRDAVICTRRLKIRYLWIDSICIIQGDDGDFTDEAKRMEDVFSGAYCVLAASRANDQRDGFLGKRTQRKFITLQPGDDEQLFVCEPIDNFNKDVIQGSLNKRGWVLQERALARRTIYFTQTQTYFECGCGVRCETLAKMHK
jgi:serine/threonine protein kinase